MGDQERIDISATKQGNGGRATEGSSQGDHEGRPYYAYETACQARP